MQQSSGGRGTGGGSSRMTRISKEMSYRLRHNPPAGMMDASGWITLSDLQTILTCTPSEAEIREVIAINDKKRFVLSEAINGQPAVRAAQGHSVQLESPILEPISSSDAVPCAVHVTGVDAWAAIIQDGCLRRMSRTHIHFATARHHVRRNSWATVWLRLDLERALSAGHQFFQAANGVLLCEGPLPLSFVDQVAPEELDWPPEDAT